MIITNCDSTGDSDKHWPFLLEVATRIPTHPRPPVLQFSIVYVQNSSRDSQATSSSNLREFGGN